MKMRRYVRFDFVFFNDTATTEIYTLSLHDALPISAPFAVADRALDCLVACNEAAKHRGVSAGMRLAAATRSEEHTSELQSRQYLVCRLLLEKKKIYHSHHRSSTDTMSINTYLIHTL